MLRQLSIVGTKSQIVILQGNCRWRKEGIQYGVWINKNVVEELLICSLALLFEQRQVRWAEATADAAT